MTLKHSYFKLLGVLFIPLYSGIIRDASKDRFADGPVLQFEAKSGAAFLYFYSDKYYVEDGFRIRYR